MFIPLIVRGQLHRLLKLDISSLDNTHEKAERTLNKLSGSRVGELGVRGVSHLGKRWAQTTESGHCDHMSGAGYKHR